MLQEEGLQSAYDAFPLKKEEHACLFKIPEAYFEQFPGQMLETIRAMEASEPSLKETVSQDPFQVPQNYFEQLGTELLNKIKTGAATLSFIDRLPRANPFQLPENYFTGFAATLIEQIAAPAEESAAEELKKMAPALEKLRRKQPYKVPANYFKKPGKVVALDAATRSIKWARWTAAAAILLIFGLGGFRYFNTPATPAQSSFEQALANIPDAAIQEYLNNTLDDYEMTSLAEDYALVDQTQVPEENILKNVSAKEIEAYFEGRH